LATLEWEGVMADIGKPLKRVRVVPLTEPVPERKEPVMPKAPVKEPEKV
jgi:hypothetical protein